jgi:hypothetical protein
MLRRIKENPKTETINSYLGLLKHGNAEKIRVKILKSWDYFAKIREYDKKTQGFYCYKFARGNKAGVN